jgi:hypothetical protein
MRYCGMGTKIPRLKFNGFCFLEISEIKRLFSGTSQVQNISNNELEVKSAPLAQACSGTFRETCFYTNKHVLTLVGTFQKMM